FNGGSSSLTYKLFEAGESGDIRERGWGKAHRVGVKGIKPSYIESQFNGKWVINQTPIPSHVEAAQLAAESMNGSQAKIDYIGHRFVHGGTLFRESAYIDESNLDKLESCSELAPLHNPISLSVIKKSMEIFPKAKQFAVFDSAFHSRIPVCAHTYALPRRIVDKYAFRKYGFHGLSYSYVTEEVPKFLGADSSDFNMIACHLGTGGASISAIQNGRSIDTSMGFSPLSGLIMSTRAGDVDPLLALDLMKEKGYSPEMLNELLNKKSGLLGLSGFSSDINDIVEKMKDPEHRERAELAFSMYIHRLKRFVGGYVLILGGKVDALVFTDDIGVRSPVVREAVCKGMEWAGVFLDIEVNSKAHGPEPALLSSSGSKVSVVAMPTEEEYVICREGLQMIGEVNESIR
ncbi:MAG: acetate/propionate family kinase, partial [Candidatus Omnitrophica bacterium]|nr:acetate/propionate family kinase [Candidatus Omnitrophota bacterium]